MFSPDEQDAYYAVMANAAKDVLWVYGHVTRTRGGCTTLTIGRGAVLDLYDELRLFASLGLGSAKSGHELTPPP